jgi:hypothetical protein
MFEDNHVYLISKYAYLFQQLSPCRLQCAREALGLEDILLLLERVDTTVVVRLEPGEQHLVKAVLPRL